jgi:hypothetical protein
MKTFWLGLGLLALNGAAQAAPEEIQVYIDDLTAPGSFGTDVHNNYVVSGSGTPDYPGGEAPEHLYRLTPEFYYGATDTLELGLYILTTTQPSRAPMFDGPKVRLKFIAPHDESEGAFWGANLEIGKTSLRVSELPWGTEFKGIWGYRAEPWLLAVNTNVDWESTRVFGGPVSFDVDTKLAYRTGLGYQVGFESYNELGPLNSLGQLNRRSETLYAVLDTDLGKSLDLDAGIGRGLTTVSDRWIVKFIVGIHY